jgi:sulfate transport system substrate-binding protein
MKQTIVRCLKSRDWLCRTGWGLGVALLAAVTVYGRIILANSPPPDHLVVYAFSTQEEVFTQTIIPGFERLWKTETGRDLTVEAVFGPSGTLAGQINLGAPADVAIFSSTQHVTCLKIGRKVGEDTQPIVIGHTPMVIVTRPGNPADIASFKDLSQPNLELIHADPGSSGAGQWAVLAEFGSALPLGLEFGPMEGGNNWALAEEQLQSIWRNVRLLAPSARAAMSLFELGAGDAFVTYEQDARLAQDRGVALDIVVPSQTVVAQHVAVIVDERLRPSRRPVAEAFVRYLLSADGRQALRRYHLRTSRIDNILSSIPSGAFIAEDLGGWPQAYSKLIQTLWQSNIEPRLDLEPAPRLLNLGGD